jgi:hypothetical protein
MSSRRKEADPIPPDECWGVLERAAGSSQLKRAARAREFLFYVGTKAIKEGSTDIHEQEIGHAIFDRDENYDTSLDNIVRVSATDLRKRIEGYFANEGAEEPLIFEIPRGSYSPVFRWRAADEPKRPDGASSPAAQPLPVPYYRQVPFLVVSAAAVLLAVACAGLLWQNRILSRPHEVWDGKPALATLWPRFLDSPRPTDVILADASYGLLKQVTRQPFTLSEYLNYSYMDWIQQSSLSPDRKADLAMIMARNHGGVGDFLAAHRIWLLDPTSPKLNLVFAREYSADAIKRDNVILIGGQVSNPWGELFYNQMPFTIEYDAAADRSYVRNANPRPGERDRYNVIFRPDGIAGYSVIAYLPNPSHTADALIVAGTDSQATDAAAEFVTSEAQLSKLFAHFPAGKLPYFEALLKISRLNGTPLNEGIVTYRTF